LGSLDLHVALLADPAGCVAGIGSTSRPLNAHKVDESDGKEGFPNISDVSLQKLKYAIL
jgi:hypothetical protein